MFLDFKVLVKLLDDNYNDEIELYCNGKKESFIKHSYFPYKDNVYFFMKKADLSNEHIFVYELIPDLCEVNLISDKTYLTELKEAYLKHFNIEVSDEFK